MIFEVDLSDDQRKALTDALASIPVGAKVIHPMRLDDYDALAVFWETLGRKYFLKGRSFDDALNSARGEVADAIRCSAIYHKNREGK